MEIFKISDMKGGWFAGDFLPTAYKTKEFEVCYKKHYKGEEWPTHYHKISTEINLLIKGSMIIQETKLNEGDIFILKPFEIANPIFLEDCEVLIVKTPSSIGDKYEI
jgi:hypoxanthine phosphoribosyltransferase